jgi:hypothetical protein
MKKIFEPSNKELKESAFVRRCDGKYKRNENNSDEERRRAIGTREKEETTEENTYVHACLSGTTSPKERVSGSGSRDARLQGMSSLG